MTAALIVTACMSPPLESPAVDTRIETKDFWRQDPRNKIDVLFLVDNSGSMGPMASELQKRFDSFLDVFQKQSTNGVFADLHIGVVTSDMGAGPNGCSVVGGDRGLLIGKGKAAASTCVAPAGKPYIEYAFTSDHSNPNNLPVGQSLADTFRCMASVVREPDPNNPSDKGVTGCGYEHQLESVYAALHNNQNGDFLRPDALLAVVFVTNEDDCSAPPDSDLFESVTSHYGAVGSFRCARYGVECNGQPLPSDSSNGDLTGCVSVQGGKLYDLSRYIDLFTKPAVQGGVKEDPDDVFLVGIDAPTSKVEVVKTSNPNAKSFVYPSCPVPGDPSCVPVLNRSCHSVANPSFYGDPAVRLNQVIAAARHPTIASICADQYGDILEAAANEITSGLVPGCLEHRLTSTTDPDCVVEDVLRVAGVETGHVLPRCDRAPGTFPCWKVEVKASCSSRSPQSVGITIDRNGVAIATNTFASVRCATVE